MARKKKSASSTAAPAKQTSVAATPRPARTLGCNIQVAAPADDDLLAVKLDFRREDIDFDILETGFSGIAQERWNATPPSRRDRRIERRFNGNRNMRRHAAARAYNRYLDEGGEEGNITGFLDWVIANWESIFAIIKSIIGLFSGAAV